jgi:hypothetical protein
VGELPGRGMSPDKSAIRNPQSAIRYALLFANNLKVELGMFESVMVGVAQLAERRTVAPEARVRFPPLTPDCGLRIGIGDWR